MTRVGYGDLLGIPNARWGKGAAGVTWLLRATFGGGNQAAPLPSPLGAPAVEVGNLTLVQIDGQFSITGNAVAFPEQATVNYSAFDQGYVSAGFPRAAGLAHIVSINRTGGSVNRDTIAGWANNAASLPANLVDTIYTRGTELRVYPENISTGVVSNYNTLYRFAVILRTAGSFVFAKGGALTSWTLVWARATDNTSTMYACFVNYIASGTFSDVGVRQLPAPFDTDYGIASQNVASPVSGTSYTATADAITDLTLTAPNPLADQAGYRYRYTDDNNCWHSYFNSAGAYRLDSVAASVATNRVNVAAAIAAAGTSTMRTISSGSLHDAYTLASTTWTKRGTQINVSHLNTNTAIRPYVTGSWAMSNLRSYPVTDPRYDAELDKT